MKKQGVFLPISMNILMRRSINIARQAGKPEGWLGRLIAFIMSFETSKANKIALDLLEIQPNDKILEVGFAHGKVIRKYSARLKNGLFAGIDISETMLIAAKNRNRRLIRKGIVELKTASVEFIPYPDDFFDKIFSVHTVYFWKDYRRSFSEISRVMKQGAKLVIGFRYDEKAKDDFPREVYTFLSKEELSDLLISEGFMIEHCKQDINRKQSFFWTVASKRLT